MLWGILGKKIGMTHIFDESGNLVSVTAIEAGPCPVLAIRDKSVQMGFDLAKEKALKKPVLGIFKKIGVLPRKIIRDFGKMAEKEYKVGEELKVDLFKPGDYVDVSGISKGKGFAGGMKRWHWHGGPMTHGSTSHRRVGSLGSTTTPGRVWKGHHLPGHMGNAKVTVQNLKVIKVDIENNLLVVDGPVPGSKNGYLMVTKAKKKKIRKPPTAKQTVKKAKKK